MLTPSLRPTVRRRPDPPEPHFQHLRLFSRDWYVVQACLTGAGCELTLRNLSLRARQATSPVVGPRTHAISLDDPHRVLTPVPCSFVQVRSRARSSSRASSRAARAATAFTASEPCSCSLVRPVAAADRRCQMLTRPTLCRCHAGRRNHLRHHLPAQEALNVSCGFCIYKEPLSTAKPGP